MTRRGAHMLTDTRGILANTGGIAAMEFAMVFPVLFLLLLGVVEMGFVMMIDASLERAVRDASRYGITGAAPDGATRTERIREMVEERVARWLDNPSQITLDTRVYGAFDNIGEPEPFTDLNDNGTRDAGEPYDDLNGDGVWNSDMGAAGEGGREEIVVYTVEFNRPTVTGILSLVGIDRYDFSRRVVVQNE
ncbi:MAG: hypothetical protein VR70_14590 [Rhodospirillaceae bacterium BRH_c57]|nr:MAG: hypothetical protein VR70_14590 [Rhodospirillaceae bacterium BRH_c57]